MTETAFDPEIAEVIADDLVFLARLHDREADSDLLAFLKQRDPDGWFALRLQGAEFKEGARLMREALREIPSPAPAEALDNLAADYAAIYLTHAYRASPCESFWRDEDNLERQEPMFEARAWYEKHGVQAPDWRKRAEDHIAFELEFLARLLRDGTDSAKIHDAADFLRTHPLRWVAEFAQRVVARCQEPFYAGAALLTLAYLLGLRDLLTQAFGLDMTIPPEDKPHAASDGARRPTCADPPAEYRAGLA